MATLNTDIRYIKGVGEARAKAFEKLGVFTLGDLIAYYPRRWEDRSQLYPIRDLPEGEYACCKAMIAQPPTTARIRGGQTLVQVRAVDEGGVLDVSFFHQFHHKLGDSRNTQVYVFRQIRNSRRVIVHQIGNYPLLSKHIFCAISQTFD